MHDVAVGGDIETEKPDGLVAVLRFSCAAGGFLMDAKELVVEYPLGLEIVVGALTKHLASAFQDPTK